MAELACVARPPHYAPWWSSLAWCCRGHASVNLAYALDAASRGLGAALRAQTQLTSASSRTDSKRGEDQDPFFSFRRLEVDFTMLVCHHDGMLDRGGGTVF